LIEILLDPADKSQVYVAEISQPACTAVQIGLTEVLNSWDIVPFACLGHSSGWYTMHHHVKFAKAMENADLLQEKWQPRTQLAK
jgi:acyl transferase domain-containing protein